MKHWRIPALAAALLLITVGCSYHEKKEPETLTLKWMTQGSFISQREDLVNSILNKKGLPYRIKFISKSGKDGTEYFNQIKQAKNQEDTDLIFSGYTPYSDMSDSYNDFVKNGLYLSLNSYLDSELGKKLIAAYNEKVWGALRYDGKIYAVTTNYVLPWQMVAIYNDKLAEKYSIDPSQLRAPLWDLEPILKKLSAEKKENSNFVPVEYPSFEFLVPDYTEVSMGLFVDEKQSERKLVNIFSTEYGAKIWKTVQDFQKKGYLQTKAQYDKNNTNGDPAVINSFLSYNSIPSDAYFKLNFPNRSYVKTGGLYASSDLHNLSNGVASWSKHPQQAFELLASIMSDADLSNALAWGEEGKDYTVTDGHAVKAEGPLSLREYGNNFLTYPNAFEPKNKNEDYNETITQSVFSKAFGFRFEFDQSAKQVAKVFSQLMLNNDDIYQMDLSEINKQLNEAGAQTLLEKYNRQLAQWDGKY